MPVADRILNVESGGNPYARNPRSSATGPGQFIDRTWLEMMARHRPDLTTGRSPAEILAMRTDPALSRAMTEAYAGENAQVLRAAGLPVNPGTTYLAHFAGPQGAVNVLTAPPSTPAAEIMGPAAAKANPFLVNMTVGDLAAWAGRKMGGPSGAPPQNIAPAASVGAPMGISPDLANLPAGTQPNPNAALQQSIGQMMQAFSTPKAGPAPFGLPFGDTADTPPLPATRQRPALPLGRKFGSR